VYLDAFTLAALVDEFMDCLVGGRVQDTLAVDETGIGLEIYARHQRQYLYISADNQRPRLHIVPDKLRRGLAKPTQLGLLLRRKVEGGVVVHVSQPPWERIVQIDIEGPEGELALIVEPMERRSNILLVQRGVILDCIRRVGPADNRYRVSLPGQPYIAPPPQTGKLEPGTITVQVLKTILAEAAHTKRNAQQLLSANILAVSPLLAREVLHRAGYAVDAPANAIAADRVWAALNEVFEPLLRRNWEPGVVAGERGIEAFSVYPLRSMPGWHRVESVSAALTQFYDTPVGQEAYRAAKLPIAEALEEARAKLGAKLASLQRSLTDDSDRERLRQSGELILAYQYAIAPGQTELRASYDADGADLVIALDPMLSAVENAQRYFERYQKAKRALEDVPALIETTSAELAYLEQLATDLELAANWPEIDEVQAALEAAGHWRGKKTIKPRSGKSVPLRVVTPEGFVIWVGRNSRQNEQVTFEKGSPSDLWLHARGVPGAHVIIKSDGRSIPPSVIERAASLAAYYSARRGDTRVAVDQTLRQHVRKIKGAAPGMVIYRHETTLMVQPKEQADDL